GGDYDTDDGTCIRDYIHVSDLAAAHLLAMEYLLEGNQSAVFNLGNANGYSVRQIIRAAERITGKEIKHVIGNKRPGDPARLIGSAEKAKKILNWAPRHDEIDEIIETAWKWHKNIQEKK
ncbi:MAG TPA: GDP-mannose 4,6-dehydratase, partial [Geobacteraceae bacterium]|nr:GDP-mannose 4,6-dehydratase [Geobacteraceae bacterium]